MSEVAPNGSRWYAWGHHYEVVGQGRRDGEPAVYVRRLTNPGQGRKLRTPFVTRLLVKYGSRHEDE